MGVSLEGWELGLFLGWWGLILAAFEGGWVDIEGGGVDVAQAANITQVGVGMGRWEHLGWSQEQLRAAPSWRALGASSRSI